MRPPTSIPPADLAAGYQLVKDMRPIPLTKEGVMPLVVAALRPIAAVAATQAPVPQVLGAARALLPF